MKNLLLSFMLVLMALPAALPWMPHGAAHALHDQHATHHEDKCFSQKTYPHDHKHLASGHANHAEKSAHHAIAVDIVTYFNDYLHVDLQSPDQTAFAAPSQHALDMDFDEATGFFLPQRFELAFVQNRAPPVWQSAPLNHTPIYLSTQRIRI